MAKTPTKEQRARLRSQAWFNNPANIDMTAIYIERTMNYGLSREELQSGRPIIGIAPYNITSSVTLVIAQRLARRLCSNCKRPANLPEHALLAEGFTQAQLDAGIELYEAVGCDECTEGYKGRTGIYQVMPMTDEIATIVLAGGNALQIAEAAQQIGVNDLRQSALKKAAAGITSLAEINRVTKD